MHYMVINPLSQPHKAANDIITVASDTYEIMEWEWSLNSRGELTVTFVEDGTNEVFQVTVRRDDIVESGPGQPFRVLPAEIYHSYAALIEGSDAD